MEVEKERNYIGDLIPAMTKQCSLRWLRAKLCLQQLLRGTLRATSGGQRVLHQWGPLPRWRGLWGSPWGRGVPSPTSDDLCHHPFQSGHASSVPLNPRSAVTAPDGGRGLLQSWGLAPATTAMQSATAAIAREQL